MNDVPAPIAPITEDVACRRCGYNLRTLAPNAKCPECGTPVADSLRGNLLRDADPEWVERLSLGAGLKLWNIALAILGGLAAGTLMSVGLPPTVVVLFGWVGGALGLWATFAITTQEPRIALQEDPVTLRKSLRVGTVIAFVGGLLSQSGMGAGSTVVQVVAGCLSLAGVFVVWGELVYFRRFADRIPDEKLRRSTTLLMWIAPITFGLIVVAGAVAAFLFATKGTATASGTTTTASGPAAGVAVGACFFSAFGLYLVLWYVRVLTRYRKAFKESAAIGRRLDDADSGAANHSPSLDT